MHVKYISIDFTLTYLFASINILISLLFFVLHRFTYKIHHKPVPFTFALYWDEPTVGYALILVHAHAIGDDIYYLVVVQLQNNLFPQRS